MAQIICAIQGVHPKSQGPTGAQNLAFLRRFRGPDCYKGNRINGTVPCFCSPIRPTQIPSQRFRAIRADKPRRIVICAAQRSIKFCEWPIHSLIRLSGTPALRSTAKRKRRKPRNPPRFPAPCSALSELRWSRTRPARVVRRLPSFPSVYPRRTRANLSGMSTSRIAFGVFGVCSHLCQTHLRTCRTWQFASKSSVRTARASPIRSSVPATRATKTA
jgi:hypothetical protein